MVREDHGATGTETLFESVRCALQTRHAVNGTANGTATEAQRSTDALVRHELREWWHTSPLNPMAATVPPHDVMAVNTDASTRDRYVDFYRRLVATLRQQQLLSGDTVDNDVGTLDRWIDTDWHRDERVLQQADHAADAFVTALMSIVFVWVRSTDTTSSDVRDPRHAVAVARTLRDHCHTDGNGNGNGLTTVTPTDKKPMTMAEKLAHMRSKRSVKEKETSARAVVSTAAVNVADEPDPSSLLWRVDPTPATLRPGRDDTDNDDAAQYFTIETRLELKDRLVSLQQRLDELLLQTKLAWMKCFAHHEPSDDHDQVPSNDSDDAVASQLVTRGESLASHLLDAFDKARKPTCPIHDYKALVATCEAEFEAFQAFVQATAAAPSPVRTRSTASVESIASTTRPTSAERPRKPRSVAFDLPSMKAYYDKAAPSYAAYLPSKKK